jgi:hypothetical protein
MGVKSTHILLQITCSDVEKIVLPLMTAFESVCALRPNFSLSLSYCFLNGPIK